MSTYKFGDGHNQSEQNIEIQESGNANLDVETGNFYDKSKLHAKIIKDNPQIQPESPIKPKESGHLNQILAYVTGVVFIVAILVIAIFIPNPTHFQAQVFAVVLALAAGGFATSLSGMLKVDMKLSKRVAIGATGALAVFTIVYFFTPALSH
jgi:VIT1/CCC1 family predicted Fe2+/Mn2+ transporter